MKSLISLFIVVHIFIANLYSATQGTDSNSISKEMNKLLSIVSPKAREFKWSCETVTNILFPIGFQQGRHITDKCILNTDVGDNIKVTCEYSVLPGTYGSTECNLGW